MARPKKEKELRHNHQIMLRLTDTEYEIISTNAKNANLPLEKYARKQLMNKMHKKVIVKYELVADLPELKKLTAEFGKIDSNLNQIVRHFNTGGIYSYEMRKAIHEGIADIYEPKYEVMKLAGDFTAYSEQYKNTTREILYGDIETHCKSKRRLRRSTALSHVPV